MQRGLLDPEKVDPFTLFVESGNITYCLYKDSDRILGNTFGMCILQVCCFTLLMPQLVYFLHLLHIFVDSKDSDVNF